MMLYNLIFSYFLKKNKTKPNQKHFQFANVEQERDKNLQKVYTDSMLACSTDDLVGNLPCFIPEQLTECVCKNQDTLQTEDITMQWHLAGNSESRSNPQI